MSAAIGVALGAVVIGVPAGFLAAGTWRPRILHNRKEQQWTEQP